VLEFDASVSVEELSEDEPRAMEDARDGGLGLLQRVENASDLAQPNGSVCFKGQESQGGLKG
jgi:hypothetical protein